MLAWWAPSADGVGWGTLADVQPVREVVVLGSTGSIGTQALDVVHRHRDRLRVTALAARGGDVRLLAQQVVEHEVPVVAIAESSAVDAFTAALHAQRRARGCAGPNVTVLAGPDAVLTVAGSPCDVVLNGLSGAAGLEPTLAALRAGRTLALANKESLIIGGPLVQRLAAPGQIVPVDSEHSALAQCLLAGRAQDVRRLVLTASGGPFRGWSRAELAAVTPAQALDHPTWSMGPLVTVNSATLMNKGLEVVEAHLLFGVPLDDIHVVVHPQSVVHSMVEFVDGSTLAQASPPDMRIPIALGLTWPDRLADVAPACDWSTASSWQFLPLDDEAFPAVRLARSAGAHGGTAPAVLNGANEVLVAAFLAGRLPFPAIVDGVAQVLAEHLRGANGVVHPAVDGNVLQVADVLQADSWARRRAQEIVDTGTRLAT
jgi:1-deoxy-D-xylulose-5-phosphate reductoisomerase